MTDATQRGSDETENAPFDWSRRRLLRVTGAGAGLAALGGASTLGVAQEEDEDGEDENGEGDGDDGHFVEDLVDPTFGYPLAADETDDLELEHTVEVTAGEDIDAHDDFPLVPAEDDSGDMVEAPAEFVFDPVGLHVEPGDLVHFAVVAHLHTVTAFHEKFHLEEALPTRVPAESPGFTSPPLADGESWVYRFETSGVYDYLCLPHLELGMVGRIVVFDPEADDLEDEAFEAPPSGPLPPNVERVFGAEELEPTQVVEEGPVAWEDLTL